MVRAKDYRHAIDGRFERVVDAYAKTAANISHLTIAIDGRKETDGIDNETVHARQLACVKLRIAHIGAL